MSCLRLWFVLVCGAALFPGPVVGVTRVPVVTDFMKEVAGAMQNPASLEGSGLSDRQPAAPPDAVVRVVLRGRFHDVNVPHDVVRSLRTFGHTGTPLAGQGDLVRAVKAALGANTSYTTRALEELLPASTTSRLAHLELLMEEEDTRKDVDATVSFGARTNPAAPRKLLHQLYFDMRDTDNVEELAVQACDEFAMPGSPQCLEYMANEVRGVFAVPLEGLGPLVHPVESFLPKAHYTHHQLPVCVLMREGFDGGDVSTWRVPLLAGPAPPVSVPKAQAPILNCTLLLLSSLLRVLEGGCGCCCPVPSLAAVAVDRFPLCLCSCVRHIELLPAAQAAAFAHDAAALRGHGGVGIVPHAGCHLRY